MDTISREEVKKKLLKDRQTLLTNFKEADADD